MINVEITRNANENALSMLRRFSRKVKSSGIIQRKRSLSYNTRTQSTYKVKMRTLETLKRRADLALLTKQGKAPEVPARR